MNVLQHSNLKSSSHCGYMEIYINIYFFLHTLTHYVITRFLRFPEGFFLLNAVAILSLVLVQET